VRLLSVAAQIEKVLGNAKQRLGTAPLLNAARD